jgi:hypothetical protein
MANTEIRTLQLPIASTLIGTDKVLVIKAGVTSIADVNTVNSAVFLGKTTDILPEGSSNLYYSSTRVSSKVIQMLQAGTGVSLAINESAQTITISASSEVRSVNTKVGYVTLTTDDIPEGTSKYFTDEKVDDRVANLLQAGSNVSIAYDDNLNRITISSTGNVRSVNTLSGDVVLNSDNISQGVTNRYYSTALFDTSFSTKSTTNLTEGTNLYFTPARVVVSPLTGLTDGSDVAITFTDTIVQAFGKTQTQITTTKNNLTSHTSNTSNPHNVTKTQVGLDNVPNVNTSVASNITSGILPDARLSSNVTQQGNTFNGASQLLQLTAAGKLPAIDGSLLTGLVTQLSNLTDIQFDGLQVGQSLAWNGTKWVNTPLFSTVRHDFQGVYSYIGKAPQLSSESANVWKITRIQVLTDGNVLVTQATNVSWTGRLTHTYNIIS